MTAPIAPGPPFAQPTSAYYPGAVIFPDVNTTVKPMVTPIGGHFLYSKTGVLGTLFLLDSSGVETALGASATPSSLIAPAGVALTLGSNALAKWTIPSEPAGTSSFKSLSAVARIIGGSSGLSIRDSTNVRDNFAINDAGGTADLNNGTNGIRLQGATSNGEFPAGGFVYSLNNAGGLTIIPENGATAGRSVVMGYWGGGPATRSAVEVTNVAAGFGTLRLMRSGGNVQQGPGGVINDLTAITYSASITPDASANGNWWRITVTNGTAFTINNPVNAVTGMEATLTVRNTSGGAHGAITFGAQYKLQATSIGNIANGFSRSAVFKYDGTNWIQVTGFTGDIAN